MEPAQLSLLPGDEVWSRDEGIGFRFPTNQYTQTCVTNSVVQEDFSFFPRKLGEPLSVLRSCLSAGLVVRFQVNRVPRVAPSLSHFKNTLLFFLEIVFAAR